MHTPHTPSQPTSASTSSASMPTSAASARRQRGFTLIEMMVTVAVAVILMSASVPSLRSFSMRNQVTTFESAFMSTLAYARTEAARRGTAVFVVAAPGGTVGNEYGNGWDVYADTDADGVYSAADRPSLRHYDAPPASVMVRGSAQITISASGYLTPAAALSFKVCQPVVATDGYLITVPPSGSADVVTFPVVQTADCTA